MSLKIKLKKMAFTKICCLILFSCQITNLTNVKFKDLEDYKKMTQYIIAQNYHYGFAKIDNYGLSNAPDSAVSNFIQEKKLVGIYFSSDSIIRYNIGFKSILSKGKELYFDFSSHPPTESYKRKGVKQVVLEKGIYYIEY